MQLRLSVGFDGSGNPVMRTRSYANIKPGASDEAVFVSETMRGISFLTVSRNATRFLGKEAARRERAGGLSRHGKGGLHVGRIYVRSRHGKVMEVRDGRRRAGKEGRRVSTPHARALGRF